MLGASVGSTVEPDSVEEDDGDDEDEDEDEDEDGGEDEGIVVVCMSVLIVCLGL